MAVGPQVQRLRTALTGADADSVGMTAREWKRCRDVLESVSLYLENSSPQMRWAIGGDTGPAVDEAFTRSAVAMRKKAAVLNKGADALDHAGGAITTAKTAEVGMKDISQPTPYRAPTSNATDEELQKESQSKGRETKAAQALADQEENARLAVEALDEAYGQSSDTMKQIHGEPDPPPPPPAPPAPGSPVGNGGSTGGRTGHAVFAVTPHGTSGQTTDVVFTQTQHDPQVEYVPTTGGSDIGYPQGSTTFPTGSEIGDGQIGGTGSGGGSGPGSALGIGGATAGGMAAGLIGAKITGAIKGGLFPGSGGAAGTAGRGTAASAVRGIGSSARTGGSGTIGRSGAAGGAGAAGRSGAGAGATGRSGAGASGRSGAGGRAGAGAGGRAGAGAGGRAGAGAGGRSGRGKDDEDGKKRELFDVGEDWVDDEGAAPGVLD